MRSPVIGLLIGLGSISAVAGAAPAGADIAEALGVLLDPTPRRVAELMARANEQTTVSVHLDDTPSRNVEVNSIIGTLVVPCNPLLAEACEIPVEPLAKMLRDAGAPLPADGIPCDRATVDTLEACLRGFVVSPSRTGEELHLTTHRVIAADRAKSWHSYVGENVEGTVRSIENRGFKCQLNFTSVDRAMAEYMATVQLSPSEIVVLHELQEFRCSQQIIGIDLGHRTAISGKALAGDVTSLVLHIERARRELRRDVYLNYIDKSINLSELSILEQSDYGISSTMDGCPYVWNEIHLLFKFSDDISIYMNANSIDQMANCVAYVHAKRESARRNKIHEVERKLWDERVQPDIDEGKRRQLRSDDF